MVIFQRYMNFGHGLGVLTVWAARPTTLLFGDLPCWTVIILPSWPLSIAKGP